MTTPAGYPRATASSAVDPTEPVYREPLTVTAIADATGTATATFDIVPMGYRWLIDYLVVSSNSAAATACNVYEETVQNKQLLDGTAALGNGAVAAYVPARTLASNRHMIVVWTGATVGAVCNVRLEYRQQSEG